ncbi:MAG TPA: signal peptidase II [Treponemataceae bacterium]|nr:signal peptidase II [Treponemataceae bacterium]
MNKAQGIFRRLALVLGVFAANFAVDRVTKILAAAFLKGKPAIRFLNDLMILKYAENNGAFLSMGAEWPPLLKYSLLLGIPIILCLAGLAYCLFARQNALRIGLLVTIIAGGISNLIDRLLFDFNVVDFLNFGIGNLRTGILNVADLSITFGAIALVLVEMRAGKTSKA